MESWIIDPFKFNMNKLLDDKSYNGSYRFKGKSKHKNRVLVDGFEEFLECRTGNISKVGKKSTGSSPSFLDYLSLQSRVFFPGLLKE